MPTGYVAVPLHQAAATSRRTALAIRSVLCSLSLRLAATSAGDRDSRALQGRQERLKLLVGRLIDRERILYTGLAEDDVAVPVLVGAGHGYRQEPDVEAPHGPSEDLQDAAVEGDHAVRSGSDFEQIHDGEGTRGQPDRHGRGRV